MEISVKDWWNTEQKGGPGSGNWNGPGNPRYANNLTLESSNFEVFSPDSFSKLKLNKINENIKSWDGDRKSVASQAIYFHDISHTMILSDIGQLKGIASFDIGDSFLYLSRLATKERGYGEQMMNKIFLSAKEKGIGVELMALPEARGFYEKLGMHESLKQPREKGKFSLSAKEINEILVKSLSEELSKLEPNDGVFCNTVESLKSLGLSSIFKGGPGSGNYGHEGRPGQIGGSDDIVSTMTTRYNKLHISDAGASIVTKHLRDLSKFPDNILNTLSDKGVSIYVGATGVTQLDGNAYLSGKTPVGYPSGRTWDSVAGSYFPSTKIVSVGEGENSSASVMDHEIGHAIYREILVKDPDLLQRYDEIYNMYDYTLNPFFNNATIGKSEFFAESVALQMTGELEKNGYDAVFWQYRMLDDSEEQIFVDKMQNLLIDMGVVVRTPISIIAEGNIE